MRAIFACNAELQGPFGSTSVANCRELLIRSCGNGVVAICQPDRLTSHFDANDRHALVYSSVLKDNHGVLQI